MIYDKLFDWQKQIVDSYKDKSKFGLFLDCGLGKTPTSLGFAEINNCTKILVVTINSKATESVTVSGSWLAWGKELKSNPNLHSKSILKKSVEFKVGEADMLVMNYESLYSRKSNGKLKYPLREELIQFAKSCKNSNTAIIIDESHKMKDTQSAQTKSIIRLIKAIEGYASNTYLYLLSGTPFTVGYIDLYSQLNVLGCPLTKSAFCDAFCVRGNYPSLEAWAQPIIGYKNVDALYELVHRYSITIKSTEVIKLPEEMIVDVKLPESRSFYLYSHEKLPEKEIDPESVSSKKVMNPYFRNIAYPDLKWIADTVTNNWMRSRQLSIGFQGNADDYEWFDKGRLVRLKELLTEKPDNYILFVNYSAELFDIYDICNELGYHVDVYCGDVKDTTFYDRYENQDEAKRLTNNKNIIIANYKSGSTGKNWQLYNKCIMFSIPLFSDFEQAKARVHRIGQKYPTIYYMFSQNNWLDKGMLQALKEGKEYDEKMFKDGLEVALNESSR